MNIYKYVKSINNTDIPDEYTVYTPKMLTQTWTLADSHRNGKCHPAIYNVALVQYS